MKRGDLTHLAHRCFNKPGLILPAKYQAIMGVLAPRLGLSSLTLPNGASLDATRLIEVAEEARAEKPRAEGTGRRKVFDQVGGIAVIPVEGTLVNKLGSLDPYSGMTGYDGIRVKLQEALADQDVAGILFDMDSPGGEVAGCFDLADEIYAARSVKPIWAMASEDSYSASYALMSCASRIFVPRTGGVGSIGVICGHVDWSKYMAEEGIKVTMIFAGERKNDGSPYEKLSDEAYAWIKAEIDRTYGIFCGTVARNLDIDESKVRKTEAGLFFGEEAVKAGLAHEVAAPGEVLERMSEELATGKLKAGSSAARRGTQTTRKETTMSTGKKTGLAGVLAAIGALAASASATEDEEKDKKDEKAEGEDKDKKDEKAEGGEDKDKKDEKAEGEDKDKKDEEDQETATASSEKARIKAIVNSPAAKGREALANALAFDSDMRAKDAIALLEKGGKATKPGALAAAMEAEKPPVVGAGGGKGEETADSVAARIAGYTRVTPKAR